LSRVRQVVGVVVVVVVVTVAAAAAVQLVRTWTGRAKSLFTGPVGSSQHQVMDRRLLLTVDVDAELGLVMTMIVNIASHCRDVTSVTRCIEAERVSANCGVESQHTLSAPGKSAPNQNECTQPLPECSSSVVSLTSILPTLRSYLPYDPNDRASLIDTAARL
jgi:hypothetical protein